MFKGTIPPGTLVCHTCDNPACVNPEHLFLGTHKENSLDAARKCRVNHGEKHPHHKLTVKAVQEIRNLLKRDPRGAKRIAKRYGVSDVAVYRIKNGTAWISDPAPNMEV
jgi:hypothetical protein